MSREVDAEATGQNEDPAVRDHKHVQGWRYIDDDADFGAYWFHEETGSTSFEPPHTITCGSVIRLVDPDSGAFYYYDTNLKTSSWDPPEGFVAPLADRRLERWSTAFSSMTTTSLAKSKTDETSPVESPHEPETPGAPRLERLDEDLGGEKADVRADDSESIGSSFDEKKRKKTDAPQNSPYSAKGRTALGEPSTPGVEESDDEDRLQLEQKIAHARMRLHAEAKMDYEDDEEEKDEEELREGRDDAEDANESSNDQEDEEGAEKVDSLPDLPSGDTLKLGRKSYVALERMQTQLERRATEMKIAEEDYQRRLSELDEGPKLIRVKLTPAQLARRRRLLAEERERLAQAKEASCQEERHEYMLAFYESRSASGIRKKDNGGGARPLRLGSLFESKKHFSVQVSRTTKRQDSQRPVSQRRRSSVRKGAARIDDPAMPLRPRTAPSCLGARPKRVAKAMQSEFAPSGVDSPTLRDLREDLEESMLRASGESFGNLRQAMLERLEAPHRRARLKPRKRATASRKSIVNDISYLSKMPGRTESILCPLPDDRRAPGLKAPLDSQRSRQASTSTPDISADPAAEGVREDADGQSTNTNQIGDEGSENASGCTARAPTVGRSKTRRRAVVSSDVLRQMFATIDTSGDGFVDLKEMKAAMREKSLICEFAKRSPGLNMLLRDEMCQTIFESIDVDDSGDVSLEEFVRVFGQFLNETAMERQRRVDFRRLFNAMDRNGDGSIDMFELRNALRNDKRIIDMLKCSPVLRVLLRASAYHRISSIYLQFDVDNSGTLEWPEFLKVCQLTFHNDDES